MELVLQVGINYTQVTRKPFVYKEYRPGLQRPELIDGLKSKWISPLHRKRTDWA
jgi:hypothetical protein